MPSENNDNGRAFEYACLEAIAELVSPIREVAIEHNASVAVAKNCLEACSAEEKTRMRLSAIAGIKTIIKVEPKIVEDADDPLTITIQPDSEGMAGDVRDVLIIRRSINWEIGLSLKNNHTAVKHSRLSQSINFGEQWFGLPSSYNYFLEIRPIFERLKALKEAGKKWSEVPDKETGVYLPVLRAFRKELLVLDKENPNQVPAKLLEYLIGRHDFYKVIKKDAERKTVIQCFNLHGSLNKPSMAKATDFHVGHVRMPTEIRYFELLNGNSQTTLEMMMNENWTVTFRIHSAKTEVEPSLKFDIQLTGTPSSLFVHHESWAS